MNKRTLHALAFLASLQGFCQENTVKDSISNVKEIQEVIIKSQKRKVFSDHVSSSFVGRIDIHPTHQGIDAR